MFFFIITNSNSYQDVFTILSVYALAAIRLFPSISKITINYQAFKFRIKSFELFYNEFAQLKDQKYNPEKEINGNQIKFSSKIEIKNLDFSYDEKNKIFNQFNFTINKGEIIGIVGDSGKGKSTLINFNFRFSKT